MNQCEGRNLKPSKQILTNRTVFNNFRFLRENLNLILTIYKKVNAIHFQREILSEIEFSKASRAGKVHLSLRYILNPVPSAYKAVGTESCLSYDFAKKHFISKITKKGYTLMILGLQ